MKICIIGPGLMPIPPVGWGAVERVIDGYSRALAELGWNIQVINTADPHEILEQVKLSNADVVHCHYDQFAYILKKIDGPKKIITPHFGYAAQVWRDISYKLSVHDEIASQEDLYIFALSDDIANAYISSGVEPSRIFHLPNGTDDVFRVTMDPLNPEKSICLGKIEPRKQQEFLQKTDCKIDFVGNIGDLRSARPSEGDFDTSREDYLGIWDRHQVAQNLTDYANLVLISDGEAHPLVCIEALSAGLGLVVSKSASANLDPKKEFITVIPNERLFDEKYISEKIKENREYSTKNRTEILEYSKRFKWHSIAQNYNDTLLNLLRNTNKPRNTNAKRVAIVTIATGSYYDHFFNDFSNSVFQKLSKDRQYNIFCFTDQPRETSDSRISFIHADRLGWPFDSLLRFHYIEKIRDTLNDFDNVIFMDSDMVVVDDFEPEIFDADLFAVEHPGYAGQEWAPFELDPTATTFTPRAKQKSYVQGCFFGGKAAAMSYLASRLNTTIWADLAHGNIPVWHDESYLNWFVSNHDVLVVSNSYAAPEGWDIGTSPRVIHRLKDATKLRGMTEGVNSTVDIILSNDNTTKATLYREMGHRAHEKSQRLTEGLGRLQAQTVTLRGLLGIIGKYAKSKFAATTAGKLLKKFIVK